MPQLPPELVAAIQAQQAQQVDPVLEERRRRNEAKASPYAAPPEDPLMAAIGGFGSGAADAFGQIPGALGGLGQDLLGLTPAGMAVDYANYAKGLIPQDLQQSIGGAQPQMSEQQQFQQKIQAQSAQAPAPPPPPKSIQDRALESAQQFATQEIANLPQQEDARRAEAEANIGQGAREIAPGQFYSGPERVGGTARANNFQNRAGQANLPPQSSGRGTLSMMQSNEILPSNPRARRQAELERAQQEAALSQTQAQGAAAEAQRKIIEQGGLPEQKSTKDAMTEFFLAQAQRKMEQADKALAEGKITAKDHAAVQEEQENLLMQIFQTINRFSPEQQFINPYQSQTEG